MKVGADGGRMAGESREYSGGSVDALNWRGMRPCGAMLWVHDGIATFARVRNGW